MFERKRDHVAFPSTLSVTVSAADDIIIKNSLFPLLPSLIWRYLQSCSSAELASVSFGSSGEWPTAEWWLSLVSSVSLLFPSSSFSSSSASSSGMVSKAQPYLRSRKEKHQKIKSHLKLKRSCRFFNTEEILLTSLLIISSRGMLWFLRMVSSLHHYD